MAISGCFHLYCSDIIILEGIMISELGYFKDIIIGLHICVHVLLTGGNDAPGDGVPKHYTHLSSSWQNLQRRGEYGAAPKNVSLPANERNATNIRGVASIQGEISYFHSLTPIFSVCRPVSCCIHLT